MISVIRNRSKTRSNRTEPSCVRQKSGKGSTLIRTLSIRLASYVQYKHRDERVLQEPNSTGRWRASIYQTSRRRVVASHDYDVSEREVAYDGEALSSPGALHMGWMELRNAERARKRKVVCGSWFAPRWRGFFQTLPILPAEVRPAKVQLMVASCSSHDCLAWTTR